MSPFQGSNGAANAPQGGAALALGWNISPRWGLEDSEWIGTTRQGANWKQQGGTL